MKTTFTPEDLAKIFEARDIEPDHACTHPKGGDNGSVRAWALAEGYLIEYGDSSNTEYVIWRDADALEVWLEKPDPMHKRVRDALEAADRLLLEVSGKMKDEIIKLTLPMKDKNA